MNITLKFINLIIGLISFTFPLSLIILFIDHCVKSSFTHCRQLYCVVGTTIERMISNNQAETRRSNKIVRYKPADSSGAPPEDPIPDYMNVLGMIFSMCGLMMRLKWCAWVALYCSCVSFANSRSADDAKQIVSSFMLSISAVVMCYLQNPQPMVPPWTALM